MYVSNDKSSKNNPYKANFQKQTPPVAGNIDDKPVTAPEEIKEPTNPVPPKGGAIKPQAVS